MRAGIMVRAAAIAMAALLAGPAMAETLTSPVGTWEIEMRDSRYKVEMCGDDSTQLCATLIWLGNGADSPENLPYLNTLLIDHAPKTGPNQWKGDLHIYGQSAAGTITQVSNNSISLQGCAFLVICKTYQMYRLN